MVADDLPFSRQTAYKLMAIATDDRLTVAHVRQLLPPSWATVYELTKLDDAAIQSAVEHGQINPDMQRKHALALKPKPDPARPQADRQRSRKR